MYLSLTLFQEGYQVESSISFDFWPWWGRGQKIRQISALIPCSHLCKFLSGQLIWGKNSAVFAHQNSPEHHWPVTLRKEPFLHIAVLWNSAHKTRRLPQVLRSLKDNSVRVFWCLLAWSYCSVTASKQGTLSLCNCCEVLRCSAFRSATRY